jgi:hypothetical protein
MINDARSDGEVRPSASRMVRSLAPVVVGTILLLVFIGVRAAIFGLTAPSSIAIAIGTSLFILILGGTLVLFFRNARFFVTDGQIGMRDYRGRMQAWPVSEVAEARIQTAQLGVAQMSALMLVGREHQQLLNLPLLSWRREDIERVLTAGGIAVAAADPASKSDYLKQFPKADPASTKKRWKQWALGAVLTLVLGVGGVTVVLLIDR